MNTDHIRLIISGGGTGGHIFPALSIAGAVKAKCPTAEILFVGAENRMEMQRVPAAGYRIIGLPVSGFDRKHLLKNIAVLWRLMKSRRQARRLTGYGTAWDNAHNIPHSVGYRGTTTCEDKIFDLSAVKGPEGHLIYGAALFPV